MLEQMTSVQLLEWELMFERWHMGSSPHERDDLSAAIIASTVANVNRGKGKALKIKDFLPEFTDGGDLAQQTTDAFRANMLRLAKKSPPRTPRGTVKLSTNETS